MLRFSYNISSQGREVYLIESEKVGAAIGWLTHCWVNLNTLVNFINDELLVTSMTI